MGALKVCHTSHPAGENWNHSENPVIIFKNIWIEKFPYQLHVAVEAHF